MLRKIRLIAALLFFTIITLLFLDFTGTLHGYFGRMAKIQFLPALLALNIGVVTALLLLTLAFGRVYCSVICPLGVFQDIISRFSGKIKKNRFRYSPALSWLRYGVLTIFVIALVAGIGSLAALLAPYSSYGRIASNLFAPLYQWGNNIFAHFAERADSYAFYSVDIRMKGISTFAVAAGTVIVLFILAWRNGRTYCNTICPVGTVLGVLSKFSYFKPVIDTDKCNGCGLCARNCKSSCINPEEHKIDYSRCVVCMDCLGKCRRGAIKYIPGQFFFRKKEELVSGSTIKISTVKRVSQSGKENEIAGKIDNTRRSFLTVSALFATATLLKAQEKKVDGGLAPIIDKKIPNRAVSIVPAGALSRRNFAQHCTACQLCVSVCPNGVLQPSGDLKHLMQPEMSYERGYCRPECVKCAEVCPTSAIHLIDLAEKSATQIGHAVWVSRNCIVNADEVSCGNCARHCPTGAIQMVAKDVNDTESLQIPIVNTERCIGCGACENLCPARPFSAIYVEGHEIHRNI